MAIAKKYGKYYAEYRRIRHNLQNKIYRARSTGLEYGKEIPILTRTPTKRELERLQKQSQSFGEDVFYVSGTGEVIHGRRAAREAQKNERDYRSNDNLDDDSVVWSDDDGSNDGYGTGPDIDQTVNIREILRDRLYELIDGLKTLSAQQIRIMDSTPRYRDAIYDVQAELLNAIRYPTEDILNNIMANYDALVEDATTALKYEENYSQAITAYLSLLQSKPNIIDTAILSDTGDNYEEP